jgi:hypothetical protein
MPWASFGAAITMLMLGPDGGGGQIGNGYMALIWRFSPAL